jgi:two-component system sensor histidine kinase RstB
MVTRIYIGICLSVLLAAILSFSIYTISLSMRFNEYQYSALSGLMTLVSNTAQRQSADNRQRYFDIVAQLLGANISYFSYEDVRALDAGKLAALNNGLPVPVSDSGNRIQWLLPQDDASAVSLHITSLTEQQFRAHALLFISELSRTDTQVDQQHLQAYSKYPVHIASMEGVDLDAQQKSRLRRNSVVVSYDQQQQFSVYAPFKNNRLVILGPIPQFNTMPISTTLSMLALSLIVVVSVSYWLVYRLDQRLSVVTNTLEDFREGNLGARVKLTGGDEISSLGDRINGLTSQIETLLQSQRDMMQAVSHELRTPLSRIRFRLELIQTTDQQETASGIREDVNQLEDLIDEVLEHQKLMREPEPERMRLSLDKPMLEVRENLKDLYPDIDIILDNDSPITLNAHPPSIYRLLQNLVSNACKYAEQEVVVSAYADNTATYICVDDDGPGVPEEEQRRVMDAFYRIDNSRTQAGYGLGLAICKRILDMHGGQLEITDNEKGGARFLCKIPMDDE